jgi:GrpB-like predicted nucleotidyltransferase (UPF0157 family)
VSQDDEIRVVPYDPAWPAAFTRARAELRAALGGAARAVEHIGSTAVEGLAAKPIIDLLLDLDVFPPAAEQVAALKGLGYVGLGENGIPGRHFFRRGSPRTHHLHVAPAGGDFWRSHVAFRDLLRTRPLLRAEYAALKEELARRFRGNREAYTDGKGDFIRRVLTF